MTILDGKAFAAKFRLGLKEKVDILREKYRRVPGLAVVIVGEDPASKVYVRNKMKGSSEIGINSYNIELSEDVSQEEVEQKVIELANDDNVDGIIVQLPLPRKFNAENILRHIPAKKDVDGLCSENLGKLLTGNEALISCTPNGIIKLMEEYNIDFKGKHAVVVGRSNMVGKPISILLQQKDCTVTMCHSKTVDIGKYTREADILVVAIGKARYITGDMVKDGAVVIDVGMNRVDGVLCGDVDYEAVKDKASFITPVPGGVGPMTVTMLLNNTVEAFLRNNGFSI